MRRRASLSHQTSYIELPSGIGIPTCSVSYRIMAEEVGHDFCGMQVKFLHAIGNALLLTQAAEVHVYMYIEACCKCALITNCDQPE